MVFASTITHRMMAVGDQFENRGTWASGDATGDINTGFDHCEELIVYYTGDSKPSAISVHEDLPVAGNAVTIDCFVDSHGRWIARGY